MLGKLFINISQFSSGQHWNQVQGVSVFALMACIRFECWEDLWYIKRERPVYRALWETGDGHNINILMFRNVFASSFKDGNISSLLLYFFEVIYFRNTRNKIDCAKFLETGIYLCRHKSKYFSSESGFRSKTLIFHQCCNLYDHAGQLRHSKNLWLKVVVREKFGRGQWCWFSRFFVFSLEMGN